LIVSINQPAYLGWLGYFERIASSDVHVILDHVQYEKNSFVNRNRVRTYSGSTWLTVPVKTKGRFGDLAINKLQIDNQQHWARRHVRTVETAYAGAPYWAQHAELLRNLWLSPWEKLSELCDSFTAYLLEEFKIDTPLKWSSSMNPNGNKDDLILNLCQSLGATTYLSGPFGRNYLDEGKFQDAGIDVIYQDYKHPKYPQVFTPFEPYLSALDLLLNCGPGSRDVLTSGIG
jgi:WbqC-like protein family